jgi:hypothetical protein
MPRSLYPLRLPTPRGRKGRSRCKTPAVFRRRWRRRKQKENIAYGDASCVSRKRDNAVALSKDGDRAAR